MAHQLQWKKYYPLSDKNAFICLVDHMGDDFSIIQAARVSYGRDGTYFDHPDNGTGIPKPQHEQLQQLKKDRQLIRYLMNHSHTTPFEMVEVKFMIQVPMDCWRQWIRHRTANVNEYSTRYTEAIDAMQTTLPNEWRLQSKDNKQGSSGFLEKWPNDHYDDFNEGEQYRPTGENPLGTPGGYLTAMEEDFQNHATELYQERLRFGVAKEQARKDLPLSTYTRAYWKCDLHNIFNFLRLRMDSHAQLEIRSFANCMFEIVKQICPIACEAFEDYVLYAKKFSRMEILILREMFRYMNDQLNNGVLESIPKPSSMTDREWKEFLEKLT